MPRFLHQMDAGRAFLGAAVVAVLVGFSVFVLVPVARADADAPTPVSETTDDSANPDRDASPEPADDVPSTEPTSPVVGDGVAPDDAVADADGDAPGDVEPSVAPTPEPAPEPEPEPEPAAAAAAGDVVLSEEQFAVIEVGLAILVALAATHVVGSWGRR